MQVQVNEVARVSVFGGFTFLVLCLLIGLAIAVAYRSTTAGRITAVMLVAALLVLPGILFLGAFTLSRQVAPQPRMVPTTHSFVTSEISPPSPSTHELSVPASETDSVHLELSEVSSGEVSSGEVSSGEVAGENIVIGERNTGQDVAVQADSDSSRDGGRYAWFASVTAVVVVTSLITRYFDRGVH